MEEMKQAVREAAVELIRDIDLVIERRCKGHMAPEETWLEVWLLGDKLNEVKIRHEECPGEWGN